MPSKFPHCENHPALIHLIQIFGQSGRQTETNDENILLHNLLRTCACGGGRERQCAEKSRHGSAEARPVRACPLSAAGERFQPRCVDREDRIARHDARRVRPDRGSPRCAQPPLRRRGTPSLPSHTRRARRRARRARLRRPQPHGPLRHHQRLRRAGGAPRRQWTLDALRLVQSLQLGQVLHAVGLHAPSRRMQRLRTQSLARDVAGRLPNEPRAGRARGRRQHRRQPQILRNALSQAHDGREVRAFMGGHALVPARQNDHLLPSHADHRRGRRGDAHALRISVRTAAPALDRRQRRHGERAAREHPSRRTRNRGQRADGLQDTAAEAKRLGARRTEDRPGEGGQALPLARGRRLVACALPRCAPGVGRLGERRVHPEARKTQLGGRHAAQGQSPRLGTASSVRILRPDGARLSRDLPQRSKWITRILEIRPQDARERVGNRSARHRAGAAAPRLRRRTRAGIKAFQVSD